MRKICLFMFISIFCLSKLYAFDFVIVKYRLGDWYNARQGVKNFLAQLKQRTDIPVNTTAVELSLEDERIFEHYFLFINGHVPIKLNQKEQDNLRKFILNGGFVYANDDYGMDKTFRKLISELFSDYRFEEVSFKHPIYRSFYKFPKGLPKIHEHYKGAPKGYGLFIDGRLAVYYSANSDIADGWDYAEVHKDSKTKREEALRMGINIVIYALSN